MSRCQRLRHAISCLTDLAVHRLQPFTLHQTKSSPAGKGTALTRHCMAGSFKTSFFSTIISIRARRICLMKHGSRGWFCLDQTCIIGEDKASGRMDSMRWSLVEREDFKASAREARIACLCIKLSCIYLTDQHDHQMKSFPSKYYVAAMHLVRQKAPSREHHVAFRPISQVESAKVMLQSRRAAESPSPRPLTLKGAGWREPVLHS